MEHMNSKQTSKQSWRAFFIVTFVGIAGIAHAEDKAIFYEDRAVSADGMTFHKHVDADGIIHAVVYDRDGNEIEWNEKKERPSDVVGERLAAALGNTSRDEMIAVRIALRDPEEDNSDIEPEHGAIDIEGGVVRRQSVNGIQRNLLVKDSCRLSIGNQVSCQ